MEQAGDQRGAQNFAHLLAAHAGLQRLDLLARDEVALHHLHPVRADHPGQAVRGVVQAAAGAGEQSGGSKQQGQSRAGAAMGVDGHGKSMRDMIGPL